MPRRETGILPGISRPRLASRARSPRRSGGISPIRSASSSCPARGTSRGTSVTTGGEEERSSRDASYTDQESRLRPVVVVRVAGVRPRTPDSRPSRRGPRTDPSHPGAATDGAGLIFGPYYLALPAGVADGSAGG